MSDDRPWRNLHKRADACFKMAAKAWENANNSGNQDALTRGLALCEKLRAQGEGHLRALYGEAIKVDYPGLFPTFELDGRCYLDIVELERRATQ